MFTKYTPKTHIVFTKVTAISAILDRHVFVPFRAIYNRDKRTYVLLNLLILLVLLIFSDIIKVNNISHNHHQIN